MQWITANWATITTIAGLLYTLFSVINGLVQNPEAKSFLGKLIDGLSFISRAQAPGSIKAPFTMSKPLEQIQQPADASQR
jgi:hypothetical protein